MKKARFSIRAKTILAIIVFAAVIITAAMLIYSRVLKNTTEASHIEEATHMSRTVASFIDAERLARIRKQIEEILAKTENKVMSDEWGSDEWLAYTARFDEVKESEDFKIMLQRLKALVKLNEVGSIYLSYVDVENELFVYLIDGADEDACPPGCLDPVYDVNKAVLTDPTVGFPAYVTNTEEYGWLVTAGVPVYAADGTVVGYAMTDISMEEIRAQHVATTMRVLGYLIFATALICIAGIFIINLSLIKPIKKLTEAANVYDSNIHTAGNEVFAKLDINTHDELEDLARSMANMERDINAKILELSSKDDQLADSQIAVNKMAELANKDALTGVRNKTSYNNYVTGMEGKLRSGAINEFGVAMIDLNDLKHINDTWGHNAGDDAIILLSETICGVFVHSPVFRVGGDEFVVILRNHDYRHAKELIEEFEEKIAAISRDESLEPAKRISAPLGFAAFDPEKDHGVTGVFSRADEAMYARKREMKGR